MANKDYQCKAAEQKCIQQQLKQFRGTCLGDPWCECPSPGEFSTNL